jgi:predicted MFS family arabinose efflux permease
MNVTLPSASAGTAPTASAPGAQRAAYRSAGYQIGIVFLLSINFGIVFFDRNALGFLMPFVQPDLHLSNTQVGLFASALSLTWAFAAFGIGVVSDLTGSRKGLLVIATLVFSACSFLTGIAGTFLTLLGARLLMGAAEGGVMPISQAIVASEVRPEVRGLAMGVTQNFGSNLFGSSFAPLLLTAVAVWVGWRHAFFIAGIPGLLLALCMWWFLREPRGDAVDAIGEAADKRSLLAVLEDRNVVICALMSVLLVSYLVVCWNFMPLYLTTVRHYDPGTESWLMATLGFSATLGAFLISGLSDRIGRRPLMIAMPLIGVILPLGALYFTGSVWVLAAIFFVGWGLNGIFPLFMATVPAESVPAHHRAAAFGLCMGAGEALGGVLSPTLAGAAADRVGLTAPLWIMLGVAVLAALLALGLRETAPRIVGNST